MKNYYGKIILKEEVIDGYLSINDGKIIYVGKEKPQGEIEIIDGYIAPGLVDIHCHSSCEHKAEINPEGFADYNLSHGVTSLLATFYRDIPHEGIMEGIEKVKKAMQTKKNLCGIHLEGPYLNANLGFGSGDEEVVINFDHCDEYINSGIIKQWTTAPEVNRASELIKKISDAGIIPAVGHSKATFEQVEEAYKNGAKIVTHVFDATGTGKKTKWPFTLEMSFDEACMLMDDMYYEVICDSEWAHVRKEKFLLLIKTVGIDRVIAVSDMDAIGQAQDGRDMAVVNGELCGMKVTLDKVAKNLFDAGFKLNEIMKMTSFNPAKAIGLNDRGEIATGKKADLIVFDKQMKFIKAL